MTVTEKLSLYDFDEVIIFKDPGYDDAFIGVTTGNRAVYDYDKMVAWLEKNRGMSTEESMDFISYNDSFAGADTPIIVYSISEEAAGNGGF